MRSQLLKQRLENNPAEQGKYIAGLKLQVQTLKAMGAVHMVVQFEKELKHALKQYPNALI